MLSKQYDSDIDEATEAQFRLAVRMGTFKKFRHLGLLATGGVALLPLVFGPLWPRNLLVTALVLVIGGGYFALAAPSIFRRSLRGQLIKLLGSKAPLPCEMELSETGLRFRKAGHEMCFGWEALHEVNEDDRFIEIVFMPLAIALIPKRVFESDEEMDAWMAFARERETS